MPTFRSNLTVCSTSAIPSIDTSLLFDSTYRESKLSPVSQFYDRLHAINKLVPPPGAFDPLHGQLVLLGVIAAVESYVRTLFRRLIVLDPVARKMCEGEQLPFGAALHLPAELLPEAILERRSFVSKRMIRESMQELLAVSGQLPPDVEAAVDDYVRVCQLRHCAVHRFGKLGASNAISLGLTTHSALLEKPLAIDYRGLQDVIAVCTGLVRSLNNFLFNSVLSRLPASTWTGAYSADRQQFLDYYNLFADKVSVSRTVKPSKLYAQFMMQRRSAGL